jgi:hypothetical protein
MNTTPSAKDQLQRAALDALLRHEAAGELPTSIRFMFYELEQAGVVSKERAGRTDGKKGRRPEQNLIDAVTALREAGRVPWDWIVDDTRALHNWYSNASVSEYVLEALDRARIDPWQGTVRPVILTESRTIGGVFARGIAGRYLTPVAATNGQALGFLVTTIAPLLAAEDARVLYVGDLDLAGSSIEAHTRSVLERHTGRAIPWERVAITQEQADVLRARGVEPIIKTDKRYTDGRPHLAYEAETLGQGPTTAMLRARLDELLPEPLDDVLEREEAQRQEVAERLS